MLRAGTNAERRQVPPVRIATTGVAGRVACPNNYPPSPSHTAAGQGREHLVGPVTNSSTLNTPGEPNGCTAQGTGLTVDFCEAKPGQQRRMLAEALRRRHPATVAVSL